MQKIESVIISIAHPPMRSIALIITVSITFENVILYPDLGGWQAAAGKTLNKNGGVFGKEFLHTEGITFSPNKTSPHNMYCK